MHYDGILTGEEYKFGSVAFIDRVDPDYFSLLELMKMAEHVGLEEEYYQFLWTKPGEEIKDGLRPLECEDDILTCIGEDGLNKKHHLLKVYVRKMTRFEAWKRMVDIQKQLCGSLHAPGDGFVLEEIGAEGNTITGEAGGSGSTGFGNRMLVEFRPTMAGSLHPDTAGNPEAPLVADAGGEYVGPGGQHGKNADVVVNETGMTSSQAADVPFIPQPDMEHSTEVDPIFNEVPSAAEVEPSTEVDPIFNEVPSAAEVEPSTEVDPLSTEVPNAAHVESSTPVGNTRWLEIDEILAEMQNEMLAEAEAVHIPVNDDNDSFSSPTIYSTDSQQEYWDGRYNAYSSKDSDRPFHSRGFFREATPDSSDDDDDTFIPEGLDDASLSVDSFNRPSTDEFDYGMDSNDGGSDDRAESHSVHNEVNEGEAAGEAADAGYMDSLRNEEDMLEERGWGSEEDQEFQPDQYPPFSAERDLDHAEIVIGKEFESFAAFKEFCKVNAIRSRRGVKFTVNDKIRCKCECMQKCGFWLYARIRGGSDTVKLISGHTEHSCPVEEDLRAANPSFLARHYVGRFRVDPSWSLRNFVHTVVTDFGLKINMMKAYRSKRAALNLIHGEDGEQFHKLWDYKAELERTNRGTTVDIQYDGLTFQAIYVCLDALKRGFKSGCRRFIGIDGCFLKALTGWQLLAAVGIDANDGVYPIAWAIVKTESESSWGWFIELLRKDLEIPNGPGWTFMSDRQKVRFTNTFIPNVSLVYRSCTQCFII
ncbi:hypothetical protein LINPERPRIM_LOCUS6541 [Linum perenne]